jgi:hypothetical protein
VPSSTSRLTKADFDGQANMWKQIEQQMKDASQNVSTVADENRAGKWLDLKI